VSKLQNKFLTIAAKASKAAAEKACGATSLWGCCQPKEPAILKKAIKK
jgi:cyclic lactone autoinducer peptide